MKKADWTQYTGDNLFSDINNIMEQQQLLQILYHGSWRIINPYGWRTTKLGKTLIYAYNESGLIRSFRFDRIEDFKMQV